MNQKLRYARRVLATIVTLASIPAHPVVHKRAPGTQFVSSQLQALAVGVILVGVEIAREQIDLAIKKGTRIRPSEMAQLIWRASAQMANSTQFWVGLTGASAVGGLGSGAQQLIEKIGSNVSSRLYFAHLLEAAVGSFVTFVGWDLAAQFWDQVRNSLDETEYAHSQSVSSLIRHPGVLRRVLRESVEILTHDPERRHMWLSSTWRLNIATGDFVVFLSSMLMAGEIVTILLPGANQFSLVALASLAGGVTYWTIPQHFKDEITLKMGQMRRIHAFAQLMAAEKDLRSEIDAGSIEGVKTQILQMETAREALATVDMESIYWRLRNLQSDKAETKDQVILILDRLIERYDIDAKILALEQRRTENQRIQNLLTQEVHWLNMVGLSVATVRRGMIKMIEGGDHDSAAFLQALVLGGYREPILVRMTENQASSLP